jgi:hypothetical protein
MSSIFPISLHTLSGQDPFSRTVSPIGYKFSLPLPNSNMSNTTTATTGIGMDIDQPTTMTQDVDMEGINNDYSMDSITPPEVNVVDFAYRAQVTQDQDQGNHNQGNQGMVYHSAPTSPRGTRMDTDMNMNRNMDIGRSSSAEPSTSVTQMNSFSIQDPDQNVPMPTGMGMGMGMGGGMITPIPMPILGDRKPSLFTLMNSRPNTPSLALLQVPHHNQDQQGQESPTLFDGLPLMSNHSYSIDNAGDRDRDRRMSLFGSMPNAGGVGRLSLSKGSEGIGLGLGLEHVS